MRVSDGLAVVTLAGEIDVYSEPLLHAVLQEAIAVHAPSVVVDMALVSFCDARGLGQLVATAKSLARRVACCRSGLRRTRFAGSSRSPASPRPYTSKRRPPPRGC